MVPLLGFLTFLVLLAVIFGKKIFALMVLIAIPYIAALLAGFGLGTYKFMLDSIQSTPAIVGMFIFALLFLGILKLVGVHLVRITVSTVVLAAIGLSPI